MNEENPFKQMKKEESNRMLPDGVTERLGKHAERTDESSQAVHEAFAAYIKKHYECDDWKDEDDDLLVDWAEQFCTVLRSGTATGGANTTSFVGEFLGVHARTGDRNRGLVGWMKRQFSEDPGAFVAGGRGGHYSLENGAWVLRTKEDTVDATLVDGQPLYGIPIDGNNRICFVNYSGEPQPDEVMGRYAYFLGNEQQALVNDNDIRLWRVDLKGDDANRSVRVGEPCIITVKPPKEGAAEAYKDILDTREGFVDNINYTDSWISDDLRTLLNPFKFWVMSDFTDMYVPLSDLREAYEAGMTTFNTADGQGKMGPLVVTRGTVNRMTREGRETEYDEGGVSYSMSITSSELQSAHGTSDGSTVLCNIGSACHDLTHPFSFRDTEGAKWEYAEKSTVLVFGRIGMMQRDGVQVPKMTAMGVYTNNRRARPRVNGGDTSMGQF